MISQNQIERMIEAREYRQLVVRILGNGRCRSRLAEQLLKRSDVAQAAALGLALQRLGELTKMSRFRHACGTNDPANLATPPVKLSLHVS